MKSNEKAPGGGQTPTGAVVETGAEHISCGYNTTQGGGMQGSIASILPRGEANAIPAKELAAMVGAPSIRALQAAIAREVMQTDALILSTTRHGGGYFLPSSGAAGREEIYRFIGTLTARARHTFLRLRAARRALRQIDGQEEIKEAGNGG